MEERAMKNTNLTELVFILDRSGSMGGLESDTIGGFNSMLAKQQAEQGDCRITTVLFDNEYEVLHDRYRYQSGQPDNRARIFRPRQHGAVRRGGQNDQ